MPVFLRDGTAFRTPDRLPVLPLRDVVVFPYVVMPLLVGRPASLAAMATAAKEATAGTGYVLLVAQRTTDVPEPVAADLYRTGVVARVHETTMRPDGTMRVLVEGIARVRITRYAAARTAGSDEEASAVPLIATVEPAPFLARTAGTAGTGTDDDDDPAAAHLIAAERRAVTLFDEYVTLHRRLPDEVAQVAELAESSERRACAIAAHLIVNAQLKQQLLEQPTLPTLFAALSGVLAGEIELLRLERKLDDDVRGTLMRGQREFYLQEQLRAIHRELGTDESDDVSQLEAQIEARGLPVQARERAMREVRRLRRSSSASPEAGVSRNFLEWLLALPWREVSNGTADVESARVALDADHYGLVEVKERILDLVAVLAIVGRVDGQILCLVGPPGVGKTSLARSMARALGRPFVRVSLGGVRDEAEIRGHRRTYVGAMPGRIIQAMRRAGVVDPVILLDEIDKLGQDYRGDPAAALLEVLDAEQQPAFNDHYLEVDYDLSRVLFVTTANSMAGIPEPLRDRMEIVRIPGYLDQEKFAIAEAHLIPRQLVRHGLDAARVRWERGAIAAIVRGWTREAGVRELERRIARVARKLARRVADSGKRGKHGKLPVKVAELPALLGEPPFTPDETTLDDKVGVATGLAYTSAGGETLEVEVSVVDGRGKLQLTGTLGDVMKESASAALSYARARAAMLGIDPDFHRTRDLHVHLPAGATPKDGPSAGVAIASAIISALTGIPVRGDVAMTGEVTLRGRVLPIGGLKEKAVAAHRNRVAHVIIPFGNARDVAELPAEVRDAVQFHPVRTMDEVLALALRGGVAALRPNAGAVAGKPARGAGRSSSRRVVPRDKVEPIVPPRRAPVPAHPTTPLPGAGPH